MLSFPAPQLRAAGLALALALSLAAFCSVPVWAGNGLVAPVQFSASPMPEFLRVGEAWRLAESIAAKIPGGDVMVGRGDSMLPLYPDRTVIVVQRMPMAALRPGMTVVFLGDRDRPVAHTLVARTSLGWTVKGIANADLDRTLVRAPNYLGTVVRAFVPVMPGADHAAIAAAPAPRAQIAAKDPIAAD